MNKKIDFILGMLFASATIIFIILFLTNDMFFKGYSFPPICSNPDYEYQTDGYQQKGPIVGCKVFT